VTASPSGYTHSIRVRYGEVDMQQVVFNAHYLAYCDDAVESWLAWAGVKVADLDWDFMLKKAVIEWSGAAAVHEVLDIAVGVRRWGTTSFDVGFVGAVGEGSAEGSAQRPVFDCTITYVGVRPGTRETMPVPESVKARLGEAPS
jgi:YbgC/YbaW family acyl-CoA thioester hydrolase